MGATNLLALLGGVGLFLFGMNLMGEGLKITVSDRLRKLIESATENRLLGVLAGIAVAAILQSSSETTVMVVGFVNAGLMSLAQSVGVIMGANIGTTVMSQILSLKLVTLAPAALFLGVALRVFSKKQNLRHIGQIIAGLGMLFIGMRILGEALAPLAGNESFALFLQTLKNPLFGILIGVLFTALIQSSSASVGLLQAVAMQGLLGLDSVAFVILGQNIGSCVTALISSIGTSVAARRAAVIHLLFNLIGAIVFALAFAFLPLVSWIAAIAPGDAVWQIAIAHTLFNVVTTAILFPCAPMLEKLAHLFVPGKTAAHEDMELKFIDERFMSTPSIAVAQIVKEVNRMGSIARRNFSQAMNCFFATGEAEYERLIKEVAANESVINFLNREITHFLIKANSLDLNEADNTTVGNLFHTVSDIERIGDHAENILEYAQQKHEEKIPFSEVAVAELREMTSLVESIIDQSIAIFHADSRDVKAFDQVMLIEQDIDERTRDLRNKHVARLSHGDCSAASGMVFVDLLTNMERAADHAVNIAQSVNTPR